MSEEFTVYKSNVTCCVPGCYSTKYKDRTLTFHNFPKKEFKVVVSNEDGSVSKIDIVNAWEVLLRRACNSPHLKVCSKHFKKDDYFLNAAYSSVTRRPRLRLTAVPSLNLPKQKDCINKFTNMEEKFAMSKKDLVRKWTSTTLPHVRKRQTRIESLSKSIQTKLKEDTFFVSLLQTKSNRDLEILTGIQSLKSFWAITETIK